MFYSFHVTYGLSPKHVRSTSLRSHHFRRSSLQPFQGQCQLACDIFVLLYTQYCAPYSSQSKPNQWYCVLCYPTEASHPPNLKNVGLNPNRCSLWLPLLHHCPAHSPDVAHSTLHLLNELRIHIPAPRFLHLFSLLPERPTPMCLCCLSPGGYLSCPHVFLKS